MPTDLRVLAGPSPGALADISDKVNTYQAHNITSDAFEGTICLQIKRFTAHHHTTSSDYFERPDRRGITWSIQVQGPLLPFPPRLLYFPNPPSQLVTDYQTYPITVQVDFFSRTQPTTYYLGTYSNDRLPCHGARVLLSSL